MWKQRKSNTMKAIKAISAALLSLTTFAGAYAQGVMVQVQRQPHYTQRRVIVTTPPYNYPYPYAYPYVYPNSGVIINRGYGGYQPYYYDPGMRRYYRVFNGRRAYYYHGWMPPR